jgi:hypothetical protein
MRKILLLFLLIVSQSAVFGQYQSQWRATQAYELPSSSGFLGINFTAEYFPVNYFSIAPSYTVFLPGSGRATGTDLNFRYYFTEKVKQWYGLFGYGYYQRTPEEGRVQRVNSHSINLGGGALFKLRDELGINSEIRYQPIGRNELIFKVGLVYFIN